MSNQQPKVSIELTAEEVKHLIKMINVAVKQVGLEDGGETANNGVYFLNKLNTAFKSELQAKPKPVMQPENGAVHK